MIPGTVLAIPTYLLLSKFGPGQYSSGRHPSLPGQPFGVYLMRMYAQQAGSR